jgi:hypothetical protein
MDERMLLESSHGVQKNRLAVYFHKLLGHHGTHPAASPSCQYQGYVATLFHAAESFW